MSPGTTGQVEVTADFYSFNSNFRLLDTSTLQNQQTPYNIEVYLDSPIDRESLTIDLIPFTLYGIDRGFIPLERTYEYNISILDFNDFPPVFEDTPYMATVSESAPIGLFDLIL